MHFVHNVLGILKLYEYHLMTDIGKIYVNILDLIPYIHVFFQLAFYSC